jgi:hypothetical protein
MLIKAKQLPADCSFAAYVRGSQRSYCITILLVSSAEFLVFKVFYPFPDFNSESYDSIGAALSYPDVHISSFGYSRFLSLFHWFSRSGTALVIFQYLTYSLSALYFYLTITYAYTTGKNTRLFLTLFLFFNPLLLYLANEVVSDILIVSLSILWLTGLIWLIHRFHIYRIFIITGVTLLILFFFIPSHVLPNTGNYFIPQLDTLGIYNLGEGEIAELEQFWFNYTTPNVWCISKDLQGSILMFFPILFLLLNGYFLVTLVLFIRRTRFRKTPKSIKHTVLIITVILGLNASYSILTDHTALRNQVFPMLVLLTFAMLLTDYLESISTSRSARQPKYYLYGPRGIERNKK